MVLGRTDTAAPLAAIERMYNHIDDVLEGRPTRLKLGVELKISRFMDAVECTHPRECRRAYTAIFGARPSRKAQDEVLGSISRVLGYHAGLLSEKPEEMAYVDAQQFFEAFLTK